MDGTETPAGAIVPLHWPDPPPARSYRTFEIARRVTGAWAILGTIGSVVSAWLLGSVWVGGLGFLVVVLVLALTLPWELKLEEETRELTLWPIREQLERRGDVPPAVWGKDPRAGGARPG